MKVDLTKLDLSDPDVQKALRVLEDDNKYNKEFQVYCKQAYDWQKSALAMTAEHNLVGLVSGNRTGKSYTSAALVTMALTGEYPSWYEGKRFDGPITCMVASIDSNTNKRIWQNYLLGTNNRRMKEELGSGMIPKRCIVDNSIVSVRGDDVQSMQIKHKSGGFSTLYFTAYSQGREAIQGFSGDLIAIDEQCPVPFLQEAITRTKTVGGFVCMTFTPLEGMDYTLEQLLDLPDVENAPVDDYGCKVKSDGKWAMVRASWEDALHIMENDPNAIEEARREYGIDFACRVYGIPAAGSGNIYPHKIENITFNPDYTHLNETWDALIGVDFGWSQNDPSAMVKVSWDEVNDVVYIHEEWKGHTLDDRTFVKNVNYIDPNIPIAWPRDGNKASDWKGGGTIADKLRTEHGLNMLRNPFLNPKGPDGKTNNHLDPGFQEINSRLGSGRLKISTECQELLKEIQFYHYGKDLNGNSTGKPDKTCEDHLCDAMRYGVMSIIQGFGEPQKTYSQYWEDEEDDFFHQTY